MIEETMISVDSFFTGQEMSRQIFEVVRSAVEAIGPADVRASKSQVAFWRQRPFAWVWIPGQYLRRKAAPLVLTLGFRRRDPSPRWKEIVEPAPGRYIHHLELYSIVDIDDEVCAWLREAWEAA